VLVVHVPKLRGLVAEDPETQIAPLPLRGWIFK
jgi:hypothetical protein